MGGNGTGMSGNLNLYSGEEDNEETEAIENILSAGSNVSMVKERRHIHILRRIIT